MADYAQLYARMVDASEKAIEAIEKQNFGAAKEILGTYQVHWMGEDIDLTPGWPRLTMIEAVKQYVGIDFGDISDDAEAVAAAKEKAKNAPEGASVTVWRAEGI